MKKNTFLGWSTILFLGIIPIFPLIFEKGFDWMFSYSEFTHFLGQITGLIGMTMFAITFVLSTRIKFIEDIFGGLDKVYITHRIVGSLALVLLLFHPVLLVLKYVPSNMELAAGYLSFGHNFSIDMGIIALLGMILLLIITFYTRLKYDRWKLTHKFFGLLFIFASLHIFLVRGSASRDGIFTGYYLYAGVVSVLGIVAFLYSLFLKNMVIKKYGYLVDSVNREGEVYDIILKPEHEILKYTPGQFIFIQFHNRMISKEPHPFSIASSSKGDNIRLVIKKLGDYTANLGLLKKGDKALLEGPYGRFNYYCTDKDKVWIAGGIGITPFLAMAQNIDDMNCRTDLYYCVKDTDEFISFDMLKELEKTHKDFKLIPWTSKDMGRISIHDIYNKSGKFKDKEFYICGPKPFKDSIIQGLIKNGVSKKMIFEEDFEFR